MYINVQRRQGDFFLDVAFQGGQGITALCGPSGSGKTSIINMIAGLLTPDAGVISVNGRCLFDSALGVNVPPEKRGVGYVFQEGRLFPHLSVRSNLLYGRRGKREASVNFARVIDLLGIGGLLSRRPNTLSGGEKQRVALGRAVLSHPDILLMDEPLASLDAAKKEEILPFILQLSREFSIPILYVSHSPDEIRALTDSVVTLKDGRVVAG